MAHGLEIDPRAGASELVGMDMPRRNFTRNGARQCCVELINLDVPPSDSLGLMFLRDVQPSDFFFLEGC